MISATPSDVLRTCWQYARRYRWRLFFILLCSILATLTEVAQPWVLKQLFDLLEQNTPRVATMAIFFPPLLAFFVLKGANWVFWRIKTTINHRFEPPVMADIMEGAFTYLIGHSYQFFADNFSGSLVKKVNRLARAFESLADEIVFRFVPIVVVLIGSVIGLYVAYPLLAVIFSVWSAVFLIINYFAARWAVRFDVIRSEIDSELSGALADAIGNAVTMKLFPAVAYEREKFSEVNQRLSRAQTKSWDRHEWIWAIQDALAIALEIAVMYLGVKLWLNEQVTLGDLAFIQTTLLVVFGKLQEVSRSIRKVFDAFADGKEMVEILQHPHDVRDKNGAKKLEVRSGGVVFSGVTFGFSRRPVLADFSLTIAPKEKVALVGPSGAGKSTITKLLFRFYDIQKGKILVDGQDIAKVTQESLRSSIALVPQEPILFHRTLLENIRYGRRDVTDADVLLAAKKAHCHEFITQLPQGYNTYVGERGIKLSGGERQRVAIARAILKNAPILVLDEATSSLDSASEALIQDALRELMQEKTVVVIAHRLSTIMQMDRIIVIEEGKIVANGTHDELLKNDGTYRKLWDIQAGGFLAE